MSLPGPLPKNRPRNRSSDGTQLWTTAVLLVFASFASFSSFSRFAPQATEGRLQKAEMHRSEWMLVSEDLELSFRKRLRSPFSPNLEPW